MGGPRKRASSSLRSRRRRVTCPHTSSSSSAASSRSSPPSECAAMAATAATEGGAEGGVLPEGLFENAVWQCVRGPLSTPQPETVDGVYSADGRRSHWRQLRPTQKAAATEACAPLLRCFLEWMLQQGPDLV